MSSVFSMQQRRPVDQLPQLHSVLEAVLIDIERRALSPESLRQVTLAEYLDLLPVLRRDLKAAERISGFLVMMQDTFLPQSAARGADGMANLLKICTQASEFCNTRF